MIMFFKPEQYVLSYCNFIWTNICERGGYTYLWIQMKGHSFDFKKCYSSSQIFWTFFIPQVLKIGRICNVSMWTFLLPKYNKTWFHCTLSYSWTILVFISKFDFIISGIQVLKGQVKGQLSQPIAQFVKWRPMATCKATMGVNPHVSVAEPSFEGRIRKPATPSFSARVPAIVR